MTKFRIFLSLIICCISTSLVWGQTLDSLVNAQQAYEQSNYEAAIQYLEITVNGGIYNAEILYNLGNAYFHSDNLGYALLNYQRAMLLNPRDLDINIQVAKIRALRTILQTELTHPLIIVEQITSSIITIHELSAVGLIAWSTLWITVIIQQTKVIWRRRLRLVLATLFVVTSILISGLAVRLYVYHHMPLAIVLTEATPTFTGPSISYFEQFELSEASEIYITEQHDEWYKFVTADSRQGWIESQHVAIVPLN